MPGLAPFDPLAILIIALINPVVIAVGLLMGRAADQPQKIVVAGFAAALAGAIAIWFAAWSKFLPARGVGGEGGIFMLQIIFGIAWAAVGYYVLRPKRKAP
jgi:uncharacterized membrane protein YphA (DoxX/SURF4 family)